MHRRHLWVVASVSLGVLGQAEDEIRGATDQLRQARPALGSQERLELARIELQPRYHLAAVAAGGTGADLARIEHRDGRAPLGEVQRRREPGETSTDDADVRAVVALEGWIGGRGRRRRRPQGGGKRHAARVGRGSHGRLRYSKKPGGLQAASTHAQYTAG